MKGLDELLGSRPKKVISDPPDDLPLDRTGGGVPPYAFPPELIRELAGKSEAEISSTLSKFRTGLSEHRTRLSEHRTDLSEHRTDLSDYRTTLSQVRSHMSNERTHLSQVRTSVALMSFGITLNRFSITLRESESLPAANSVFRHTEYIGLGMVILGIVVLLWSLWRYHQVHYEIETMTFTSPRWSVLALTIAIIGLGAASTFWMIAG